MKPPNVGPTSVDFSVMERMRETVDSAVKGAAEGEKKAEQLSQKSLSDAKELIGSPQKFLDSKKEELQSTIDKSYVSANKATAADAKGFLNITGQASQAKMQQMLDSQDAQKVGNEPRYGVPAKNDGISGGFIRAKPPGSDGQDHSTPPASDSKLPTGETPAERAKKNKDFGSTDGKLAHPNDFGRENQIHDLLNPWKELNVDAPGSKPDRLPGQKDPMDLLRNSGKGPAKGDGRNEATKQEETSEGYRSETAIRIEQPPRSGQPGFIGPRTEEQQKWLDLVDKVNKYPSTPPATPPADTKDNTDYNPTRGESGSVFGKIYSEITRLVSSEEKFKPRVVTAADPRGTPDPDKDTGDGHVPDVGQNQERIKTRGEIDEERKRQIALPGDGQQAHVRVHADPREAVQEGLRKNSDGRIDPGDRSDDGTTSVDGSRVDRPGFGTERVDGRPGPSFTGGGLPTPGETSPSGLPPDNPVADTSGDGTQDNDANKP
jgi:hypothetical protein